MIKYRTEYKSLINDTWRIDIDIPSYNGEPLKVLGVGESACTISYEGGSDDIFETHIQGSQAKINLYQGGVIDIEELQISDDLTIMVKVYKNNNLHWSGFLVPDGIQEFLKGHKNYEVNLTATDGLKSMDGLDFVYINPRGIEIDGVVSEIRCPLNTLRQCFNKLGNVLKIRWSCDLRSVVDGNRDFFAGVVPFDNHGELVTYIKPNCLWMIENIVKSANCHIKQQDGIWYIESLVDKIKSNGVLEYYEIDATMEDVIARKVIVDNNIVNPKEINDNSFFIYQKGLGKVKVEYENKMNENVLPNGSFNLVSTDTALYWSTNNAILQSEDGINNRLTDKANLPEKCVKFSSSSDYEGEMILTNWLCFDAKTLFPRFSLGFLLEPMNYDTKIVEQATYIDWKKVPLKFQISYTTTRLGITENYYLNENGYWVRDLSTGLYVTSSERISQENYNILVDFGGRGMENQEVVLSYIYDDEYGGAPAEIGYKLNTNYDTTEDSVAYLASAYNLQSPTPTSLIFPTQPRQISEYSITAETAGLNHIPILLDKTINGDIVQIQFTSKGQDSRITIPEPNNLNGVGDLGQGRMKIKFMQAKGKECRIDDFYINIDENNDVYIAELENIKRSEGEYNMEISSSFSGFLLSSYMGDYSNSDSFMLYNKNGISATLTEHYAREILQWRNIPCKIYDGSLIGEIPINSYVTIHGKKYVPLSVDYNTETNQSKVVLFEANYSNLEDIKITHKGSNDSVIR